MRPQVFALAACVAACAMLTGPQKLPGGESQWASPGASGRLLYHSTAWGDRLPDFSDVGYRYGDQALPDVSQAILVQPAPGDDTTSIQAALDSVAAMPIGPHGFRGAVVLNSGEFQVGGTLRINASGIVLRGSGNSASGTVIRDTGTDQSTTIRVFTGGGLSKVSSSERLIIDKYVPVGATSFRVLSTVDYGVGDRIIVHRPSTAEWIHALGMDSIPPRSDGGTVVQWTPGTKDLNSDRHITRIEGNRVFINAPLTNSLDAEYGGGTIYKYQFANRLENVGIENLMGVSDYDLANPFDENHGWTFISIDDTEHAFVRSVTGRHFGKNTVSIEKEAKNVTVVDAHSLDPVSLITGSRRYAFEVDGQLNLVRDSTSDQGRHDFVLNSPSPGPNVFLDNVATNSLNDTGPHQRYSTGALFDNVSLDGDEINVRNRGNFGTGHGWAGANMVIWNSVADGFIVQNPPLAQNWLIGSVGPIIDDTTFGPQPPGIVDRHGSHVDTRSLYLKQLADRHAVVGGNLREYVTGDYDQFSYDGSGSVDDVFVSSRLIDSFGGFLSSQGEPAVGFDDVTSGSLIPFTMNFELDPGDRVHHASMTLAVQGTGGSTLDDSLWYEDLANRLVFSSDLGLVVPLSSTESTILVLEFAGDELSYFQDGEFNVVVGEDIAVDWARLELTVAPGLVGDFDSSGTLDAADIDLLCAHLDSGDLQFDLTGDGAVDQDDLDQLVLVEIGTLYGDANLDRVVDASDFNLWNSHKFSSDASWAEGNFNCDNVTDASDFNIWNRHKFSEPPEQNMVPEPVSSGLLLIGVSLVARCLRSTQRGRAFRNGFLLCVPARRS